MGLRVNVVCRNYQEDRVIPRFARYLSDRLGWTVTRSPDPEAEVVYLSAYFESQRCKPWPDVPVAAYFTHREEEPPGNGKAKLFDRIARQVDLRIATARMYADVLSPYGETVQIRPPVERERFVIPKKSRQDAGGPGRRVVAGFSGYTYANHRKGEDLVRGILASKPGQQVEWRASGRGWPVPTKRYAWRDMPGFYQGLDILVITSRVEGVPMPPLEALSCGVSVVVPRGVGLLDELPDTLGIHRYQRGDVADLVKALGKAIKARGDVDREALRAASEPYSVAAWCQAHEEAIGQLLDGKRLDAGIAPIAEEEPVVTVGRTVMVAAPVARGTGSTRGIYCVAFGDPARESCRRMMESAKAHMPDVPIALCAATAIGGEDVLVIEEDSDIGGRRAKLRAYELAPAEWASVLYLDADTVVVAPIYQYFEWVEDGWELAICKDISPNDVLGHIRTKVLPPEARATEQITRTWHVLQMNGGAWSFRRCAATEAFFVAWREEWERWAQRDQGALIRALYTHPLRMLLLGNEWNTFPKFQPQQATAGLLHFPGDARRWSGQIRGRIDGPEAWAATRRFERTRRHR